jgi:hypothetical protein
VFVVYLTINAAGEDVARQEPVDQAW